MRLSAFGQSDARGLLRQRRPTGFGMDLWPRRHVALPAVRSTGNIGDNTVMIERWNLTGRARDGLASESFAGGARRKPGPGSGVDGTPSAHVRQPEADRPVAAAGRTPQQERCQDLGRPKRLAVAGRPALRLEVASELNDRPAQGFHRIRTISSRPPDAVGR